MTIKTMFVAAVVISASLSVGLYSQEKAVPTSDNNVPRLIEELGDNDILTNYYAGRQILKIGRDAVPYLIKSLHSPTGKVRFASIFLLEQIGDKAAVTELIAITKDPVGRDKERAVSALALGRMGAKEASPVLIDGLKDNSETVKIACAMSLGILREEKAIPCLVRAAQDHKEEIARSAAKAIELIGDRGVPELEKLVNEGAPEEKFAALEMLGNIKSYESIKALKKMLKSGDRYIEVSTAYILSTIGEDDGKKTAADLLKDGDPKIRVLAGKTLENIEKNKPK